MEPFAAPAMRVQKRGTMDGLSFSKHPAEVTTVLSLVWEAVKLRITIPNTVCRWPACRSNIFLEDYMDCFSPALPLLCQFALCLFPVNVSIASLVAYLNPLSLTYPHTHTHTRSRVPIIPFSCPYGKCDGRTYKRHFKIQFHDHSKSTLRAINLW
jgi:hypothetical protein